MIQARKKKKILSCLKEVESASKIHMLKNKTYKTHACMPWDWDPGPCFPQSDQAPSRGRSWLHSTGVRQPPWEQNQMPPRTLSQFPSQKWPVPNLGYSGLVKSKPSCHYCTPWFLTQNTQKGSLCHPRLLSTLPTMLPPLGEYPLWPAPLVLGRCSHHGAYRSSEYQLAFSQLPSATLKT